MELQKYMDRFQHVLAFLVGIVTASMVYTYALEQAFGSGIELSFAGSSLIGYYNTPDFWLMIQGVLLAVFLIGYIVVEIRN